MIATVHHQEVKPDVVVIVEGATGSEISTVVGDPVVVYDPATGTLTIDSTQMTEGTLTY